MSYEKTIWNTGDTITAEKMNHIENGIAEVSGSSSSSFSNVFIVNNIASSQSSNYVLYLDKTLQEIIDAMNEGKIVIVKDYFEEGPFCRHSFIVTAGNNPNGSGYVVDLISTTTKWTLTAESLTDHPKMTGVV